MDFEGIGRVADQHDAGRVCRCAGRDGWVYPRSKKWDVGISINGLLAGLVAITGPCYWVSPIGAICIGAIAGVIVICRRLHRMGAGRRPVRCVRSARRCGIFGTLSLGLFAVGNYGGRRRRPCKGLFYGGNTNQLVAQISGSVIITAARSPPDC